MLSGEFGTSTNCDANSFIAIMKMPNAKNGTSNLFALEAINFGNSEPIFR